MVNAEILQVAENLVKSAEYSAEDRYFKRNPVDVATCCVPGGARARVRVVPVVNTKSGKPHGRKVYSWSRRLSNGLATRSEIIARQEFIRRVAKALETGG